MYELVSLHKRWELFDVMIRARPQHLNSLRAGGGSSVFLGGSTLLMNVVNGLDEESFNYLANKLQDFAVTDDFGYNVIHHISWVNQVDVGKRMLIRLSQITNIERLINNQSNEGRTPLHLAARSNKHQLIMPLLRLGSDVNIRDMHGKLPVENPFCDDKTIDLIQQIRKW